MRALVVARMDFKLSPEIVDTPRPAAFTRDTRRVNDILRLSVAGPCSRVEIDINDKWAFDVFSNPDRRSGRGARACIREAPGNNGGLSKTRA